VGPGVSLREGSEAMEVAREAVEELTEFATADLPDFSGGHWKYVFTLFTLCRPLLTLLPLRRRFLGALAQSGGPERLYTLLAIARFDRNQDSTIDYHELQEYERQGLRLVDAAVQTCQNTSVVASLLIGAAHVQVIGRPTPWEPSDSFKELHSEHAAAGIFWAVYFLNLATEVLAIFLLLFCTWGRLLLINVLPSLRPKLKFLCDSNLVAGLANTTTLVILLLALTASLGGTLASPPAGYLAATAFPSVFLGYSYVIAPYQITALLDLRNEIRELIAQRSRNHTTPSKSATSTTTHVLPVPVDR